MAYRSKADQAKASKKYYDANRAKVLLRSAKQKKKTRQRNRDFVTRYLMDHPCVDCGEDDSIVLDFDHVFGVKKRCISELWRAGVSLKNIEDEIDKCEIRCSNCHRRRHYYDRQ